MAPKPAFQSWVSVAMYDIWRQLAVAEDPSLADDAIVRGYRAQQRLATLSEWEIRALMDQVVARRLAHS